jgi:hypothetical protein
MSHPQSKCSHKVKEIGYHLMELGISSQDLQEFNLTILIMKNMSKSEVKGDR